MGENERVKTHRWLIVSIPDWGKECKKVKGVTAREHVDLRRKCNSALGASTRYLRNKYNAMVLKTCFLRQDINCHNIHFSPRDQNRYNEIIFSVARRLLCDVCFWDPTQKEMQPERNICKTGIYGNIPDTQLKKIKIKQI